MINVTLVELFVNFDQPSTSYYRFGHIEVPKAKDFMYAVWDVVEIDIERRMK